jgi:hypothetical protein
MMRPSITIVRRHVEILRLALISYSLDEIEGCLSSLDDAIPALASAARDPQPESRAEIKALRNELDIVARLLENGMKLNEGWARLLGAWVAGYMCTGEAAPLARVLEPPRAGAPGRISLQG